MLTPKDNNKDNAYERVKRWREKNRALYNLRQREYRRNKNLSGSEKQPCKHGLEEGKDGLNRAIVQPDNPPPSTRSKIEELRELVRVEQERVVEEPVRPLVYRNDFGGVITKTQWEKLQEKKSKAKEGGYTLDEYSQ